MTTIAKQEARDAAAYGLFKSGIIKAPSNVRGKDWNDLTESEKTVFYKAADAVAAEQATRTAEGLREPEDLAKWADKHGLRPDWHEPDEQMVSARVVGGHLDNAMGYAITEDKGFQELVVILTVDGADSARINLADLLAWASIDDRKGGANR